MLLAGRASTKTCVREGVSSDTDLRWLRVNVCKGMLRAPQHSERTRHYTSVHRRRGRGRRRRSARRATADHRRYCTEGKTREDYIISWNLLISWITFFFLWLDKTAFIDSIFKRGLGDELQTISEQLDLPELNILFPIHTILPLLLNLLLFP